MRERFITEVEIELKNKILNFFGHEKFGIDQTAYFHLWQIYGRCAKRISVIVDKQKADYFLTND